MVTINKNLPVDATEVEMFLENIYFKLPDGFIEFYKQTNGANITSEHVFIAIWPLNDLIKLNNDYDVNTYAPEFFIFGSDGGGMAYAIEKATGHIFEMPFIGMSKMEALYKSKTFPEFISVDSSA